jgi:hypothetical protein
VSRGMTISAVDTTDGSGGEGGREATAPKSGRFIGRTRPGEGISAECGDRRRCSADRDPMSGGMSPFGDVSTPSGSTESHTVRPVLWVVFLAGAALLLARGQGIVSADRVSSAS